MDNVRDLGTKIPALKDAPIVVMRKALWGITPVEESLRILRVDNSIDLSEMEVEELIEALKGCKRVREVEDLAEVAL